MSLSFGANFWPWWRQRWQRLKWRRRRQRWRRQQWRRRRQQQEKFRQQNDNQFSTQMAFFMRGTNSQDMPSKQGIAVGWLSSTNSYFVFLDEHGRNYQLLFKFHLNLACFDSQCKKALNYLIGTRLSRLQAVQITMCLLCRPRIIKYPSVDLSFPRLR